MQFQAYKWETEEFEAEHKQTIIYIHGLNEDSETVTVKVTDFKPYVYLELDPTVKWTQGKLNILYNHFNKVLHENNPIKKKYMEVTKIYYLQKAKVLKLFFTSETSIKAVQKIVRNPISVFGIGNKVKLTMHEQKAGAVLQLLATKKLDPSGWIQINIPQNEDRFSTSKHEFTCSYKELIHIESTKVTDPLIMSYDIECVSEDPSGMTFPDANRKRDYIICICATIGRYSDPQEKWVKYAFVNADGDRSIPDIPGCKVKNCKNESNLLLSWSKFIRKIDPDIITSYNGLSFDDKYIIDRSGTNLIWPSFSQLGRLIGKKSTVGLRKWNSSAYGDQEFNYIDIQGRVHIDMFPTISKEYTNLDSYTLNSVSQHFLNEQKVDLPPDEMIQIYHKGGSDNMLRIVEYCVQDTFLPLRLMQKLNSWIGLNQTSNVMKVSMFDLITRGQQIRGFSKLYCYLFDKNIIITTRWSDYKPTDNEKKFVGATVQNPLVGFWEFVATYDFKSLYPTTIIAYNLCFSTFVPEHENPPKEDYHDLHIPQHSGCEHDTALRKSKVAKDKIICKDDHFRFYKAHIKKGIIPQIIEDLLKARENTKKEMKQLNKLMEQESDQDKLTAMKMQYIVLDKRQNSFKVSANSMYGGFGSDFSEFPFYPAAAATTGMGRFSIQQSIDYVNEHYPGTITVYGDTDSCMLKFKHDGTIPELFELCEQIEKDINSIFPKPMYLELEKIYRYYFLLTKKRYIGYMMDTTGSYYLRDGRINADKKGVVSKRRDNCKLLKITYEKIIDMVMNRNYKWEVYSYIYSVIKKLLDGEYPIELFIISKSIKETYKNTNLPHLVVSKKMKERGKYVVAGTRIPYVFKTVEEKNAPQYLRAEDPDYLLKNPEIKLDYLYYFEKQLVNPIDEVLLVKFGAKDVLKNLCKLLKKNEEVNIYNYFHPQIKVI